MIDWLCDTFGFETRLRVEGAGGRVEHAELTFGDDGLIMVGSAGAPTDRAGDTADEAAAAGVSDAAARWKRLTTSPKRVGKVTQALCVFVDDCDQHCAAARARGAEVFQEPLTHDYGDEHWVDRSYGAFDPEGHPWWFMQRVRTGKGATG
jgi:uncharacterized glyoxalase superfamily protein PhnB